MAKTKVRCPACGRNISRNSQVCPACRAPIKSQSGAPAKSAAPNDEKRAVLTKILIAGLVCAVVFGYIAFGLNNLSGGALYAWSKLLGLTSPGVNLLAKIVFAASLPAIIIPFALLQQLEEN